MQNCENKDHFKSLLQSKNIDVIFRENEDKRIYGVTFIDYNSKTVYNGSRLGKEFSANTFNNLFENKTPTTFISSENSSFSIPADKLEGQTITIPDTPFYVDGHYP